MTKYDYAIKLAPDFTLFDVIDNIYFRLSSSIDYSTTNTCWFRVLDNTNDSGVFSGIFSTADDSIQISNSIADTNNIKAFIENNPKDIEIIELTNDLTAKSINRRIYYIDGKFENIKFDMSSLTDNELKYVTVVLV